MNIAAPITRVVLLLVAAPLTITAQTVIKNFRAYVYYDTADMEPGQTNRLKTIIFGQTAFDAPNGLMNVARARIEHFDRAGQTNLVAVSPQCFFDGRRNTIHSTNVLVANAGTNQMRIEGRGYFGMLTNLYLIFSNDVTTVIRQDVAESVRTPGSLIGAQSRTNAQMIATNSDIHIAAERLHLDYQNNLATYVRNVQVDNPEVRLTSEHLRIKRSKTNNVESILAETNVIVRHKLERSQAAGDYAHYYLTNGVEFLELRGAPAQWEDSNRRGKAGVFVYELAERIITANHDAMVRFPRGAMSQTDWLPGRATNTKTNTAPANTNQFVEVHAQSITSWMSISNRPGNRMLAENKVLILGESDQTRATADRAVYNESTGELQLIGQADWQQGLRTVRGDQLQYDRTNQVFVATGNAYLKVPVGDLRRQTETNTIAGTNQPVRPRPQQFVETFSDRFDYRVPYLTFYDNVRGTLLESNMPLGILTSEFVKLRMTNQIERIVARGKVHVERFPVPTPEGKAVSSKLDCEVLSIDLRTNGTVHRIVAHTNVVAQQTSKANAKARPSYSRLAAESVFMEFFAHTNDVSEIIAERDVFLMRDVRTAMGQKAVYTGTNQLLVLTGNPSVDAPEMRIPKAKAFIYNRAQDRIYAEEAEGQAKAPTDADKKPPTQSNP